MSIVVILELHIVATPKDWNVLPLPPLLPSLFAHNYIPFYFYNDGLFHSLWLKSFIF
jgi:hypothetical protein